MGRVIELHFVLQSLHLRGEPRVAASLPGCLPQCRGGVGALEKIACVGGGPDHVLQDLSRTEACAALHRGPRGGCCGGTQSCHRRLQGDHGATSCMVHRRCRAAMRCARQISWGQFELQLPGVDHPGPRAPWALEQGLLQAFPAACSDCRRHGRLQKNCTRRANSAHVCAHVCDEQTL